MKIEIFVNLDRTNIWEYEQWSWEN